MQGLFGGFSESKRLRGSEDGNFPIILDSTDGFVLTGEIYMGRLAKMDVIYDTGSDWLIVEGSDCTNCEGNTYNIGPSLETQDAVLLSGPINHNYGASNFVGKEYTDTVCILFSACVSNFKFLLIE